MAAAGSREMEERQRERTFKLVSGKASKRLPGRRGNMLRLSASVSKKA